MDRRGFMKIIGALPLIGHLLPKAAEAVSREQKPEDAVYSQTIRVDTGCETGKFYSASLLSVNLQPGPKGILIRPFMEVHNNAWPIHLEHWVFGPSRLTITMNGEIHQGPMRPYQIGEWPLVLDKPAHFEMRLDRIQSGCGTLEIQAGVVVYYF